MSHRTIDTHTVVCSLLKTQEQVVYDYTKNKCSLIFTVTVLKDRIRTKKISTAVFKFDRDGKWYPHHVEVKVGYKRKGVATIMYDIVQSEINGMLVPSDDQSDEARAFWQHRQLTTISNKYIL